MSVWAALVLVAATFGPLGGDADVKKRCTAFRSEKERAARAAQRQAHEEKLREKTQALQKVIVAAAGQVPSPQDIKAQQEASKQLAELTQAIQEAIHDYWVGAGALDTESREAEQALTPCQDACIKPGAKEGDVAPVDEACSKRCEATRVKTRRSALDRYYAAAKKRWDLREAALKVVLDKAGANTAAMNKSKMPQHEVWAFQFEQLPWSVQIAVEDQAEQECDLVSDLVSHP